MSIMTRSESDLWEHEFLLRKMEWERQCKARRHWDDRCLQLSCEFWKGCPNLEEISLKELRSFADSGEVAVEIPNDKYPGGFKF